MEPYLPDFSEPDLYDEFGSEVNLLDFNRWIVPLNRSLSPYHIEEEYFREVPCPPTVFRSKLVRAIQKTGFTKSPLWDSHFNAQNHDTWEVIQKIFGHATTEGHLGGLSLDRDRERERISLSDFNWFFIRMLAKRGGWTPLGTTPPPRWSESSSCATWSGTYGEINGQIIEDDDARNLGAALENILGDIPDEDLVPYPIRQVMYSQSISFDSFLGFEPVEVMSGPKKEIVRTTASFLNKGSVRLHAYTRARMDNHFMRMGSVSR